MLGKGWTRQPSFVELLGTTIGVNRFEIRTLLCPAKLCVTRGKMTESVPEVRPYRSVVITQFINQTLGCPTTRRIKNNTVGRPPATIGQNRFGGGIGEVPTDHVVGL